MYKAVIFLVALAVVAAAAAPATWDARTNGIQSKPQSGCANEILNQEQCGSCWAFSTAGAITDRWCLNTSPSQFPTSKYASPQDIVVCDTHSYGCNGGYPLTAMQVAVDRGVPLASCVPYTLGTCREGSWNTCPHPACPSSCTAAGQSWQTLSMSQAYHITNGQMTVSQAVANIQAELMQNGPVVTAIWVPKDFFQFFQNQPDGVYTNPPCTFGESGCSLGGHAVKIVGWDETAWVIANSWSTSWGNHGFFRIAKGNDVIGVERGLEGIGVTAGTVPGTSPAVSPVQSAVGTSSVPGRWTEFTTDITNENVKAVTEAVIRYHGQSDRHTVHAVSRVQSRVVRGVSFEVSFVAKDSVSGDMMEYPLSTATIDPSSTSVRVVASQRPRSHNQSSMPTWAIATSVVGGVVVIVAAAAVVVVMRRRRQQQPAIAGNNYVQVL